MRRSALVVLLALPACTTFEPSLHAGYASLAVDGDIALTTGSSSTAVSQDVESALGLGDDEGAPYGRLAADFGVPVLTVSAFGFEQQGRGQLAADFGNVAGGATVFSDFSLTNVKASWLFDIGAGPFTISPGIGVDFFDLGLEVRDAIGIASEDIQLQAPLPLLCLRAALDLNPVELMVEGGYVQVPEIDDIEGSFFDVEGMLRVRPTGWLDLFAGYRWISLEADGVVDGDAFDTELEISGWLVGGGIRF